MVGSFHHGDLTYDSIQFVGPVKDELPFGDVSPFYKHAKIQYSSVLYIIYTYFTYVNCIFVHIIIILFIRQDWMENPYPALLPGFLKGS